MLMRSSKFDLEKFCELVVAAIVMHNLSLSFVEYTGIKSMLPYLREDVVLISRNTVKADIIKLHKRQKSIAVIFDPWYKIQFVEWSYTKLYGSDSAEFKKVKDHLFALYDEYAVEVLNTPSALNDTPFDEKNVHKGKNEFLK
ncbi:hypothetical protein QUC31_001222, partial [Theobroma cacao]